MRGRADAEMRDASPPPPRKELTVESIRETLEKTLAQMKEAHAQDQQLFNKVHPFACVRFPSM